MPRIAIDPITRVGGHLRIEAEVSNGAVADAWSSGTMFRGIETILRGRDPRDAWLVAQRICGSCSGAHALASVRAVEQALDVSIPRNARLVRNLLAGAQQVQDQVAHFYHLHALDWVDVASASTADPAAASRLARSMSDWPRSSPDDFAGVRDRLATLVSSSQLGLFAHGWWGHPDYRLPAALNLVIMAHYLEAFEWQRRVARFTTLLGGKSPHPQSWVVGGMTLSPPWGGPPPAPPREHPRQIDHKSPTALGPAGLDEATRLLTEAQAFVDRVYVPDVLAIGGHYRDWARIGGGLGNYLAWGEYPEDDTTAPILFLRGGRVVDRSLARTKPVDQAEVAETVAHAWYDDPGDPDRHPFEGRTEPRYAGPPLPYTTLEGAERYSWTKAPRYAGDPMEVGPLARVVVGLVEGQNDLRAGVARALTELDLEADALFSTLGRVVARAVETQVVANRLDAWMGDLRGNLAAGDLAVANLLGWDSSLWPDEAEGWGLAEGPRGALGHWVQIRDRRISGYQVVDPNTWNGSPRDARGRRGPWEEALVGTPVADRDRPLELMRTLHSFDPCAACAVHVHGLGGPIDLRVR